MIEDDRLLAAFLGLAVADRPELAAIQLNTAPVTISRPTKVEVQTAADTADQRRADVRQMLADLQSAIPERAVGEPGWEVTRPVWPDSWFEAHDPGDAAACRRLWAAALLACIRDTVEGTRRGEALRLGSTLTVSGWIESRDFHEMWALAGVDGVAVADRLARIDQDPAMLERILKEGAHKSSSVQLGGDDD